MTIRTSAGEFSILSRAHESYRHQKLITASEKVDVLLVFVHSVTLQSVRNSYRLAIAI